MQLELHSADTSLLPILQDALKNFDWDLSHQSIESSPELHCIFPDTETSVIPLHIPLRLGDIIDQIAKIKRLAASHLPDEIKLGHAVFKPQDMLFQKPQYDDIALTEKECDLLITLWRAESKYASREKLLEEVWGHQTELETHTLETHIYRLRQKIEDDPTKPSFLLTDEKGYRLGM